MKKNLVIILAVVLLVAVNSVYATGGAITPFTYAAQFTPGMTLEEVEAVLNGIDALQCETGVEDGDRYLDCADLTSELREEYYVFYFGEDGGLFQFDSDIVINDDEDYRQILAQFVNAYGLDELEEYEDEDVVEICSEYDLCLSVVDPETDLNIMIGGSEKTDFDTAKAFVSFYDLNH